jgi:hypothetical protein
MAQPPALVVQTSKPKGDLQLHRLGKRIRFHCVRCQKDKMTCMVATMGGDWAQKVCEQCYGFLVHEQRKPARKKTKEDAKEEARKEARKAANAKRQAQKARARLPGGYALLTFLCAAGVRAKLVDDGWLWINDEQIQRVDHLPRPETFEWRKIVDKIVVDHVRDKFNMVVEDNAHFGKGLGVVPQWSKSGFSIMRDDVQLAFIHPTRTYISDGKVVHAKVIHANFLTRGPHWQEVTDALHRAEPELVAGWKHEREAKAAPAAPQRPIDRLPNSLAPGLIDACLEASRRIRLERQVAYDRAVILECDVGELTLLPIAGTVTRLRMPFCLDRGTETLKAELVLGDSDPLPLLIGEDIADEDAITAWACALLGFADTTCIELEPVEPTARRQAARPRWRPSSSVSRSRSIRTLPRRRPWPSHLEPVGPWLRYSGSFVAGHRRRLNEGHTASGEARDRARQVGIMLHPHETWVQPHTRGIPDGIEMRFLWNAPTELKLFHT